VKLAGRLTNMGFVAPTFFAWCAALAEFAGGLCFALGLGTRYAAAAVAFTMFVAIYSHLMNGDPLGRIELPLTYLAVAVAGVLIGGGALSLDRRIRLRWPIQSRSAS
jgi:putative oxidoreductase